MEYVHDCCQHVPLMWGFFLFNAVTEVTTRKKLCFCGVAIVTLKSSGSTTILDSEATESWKWSNTNSINTIAPFCALAPADAFLWAEIMAALSCLCIKQCCLILFLSQVSVWSFSAAWHQQTWWVMSSTNGLLWRLCRNLPDVAVKQLTTIVSSYWCFFYQPTVLIVIKRIKINSVLQWDYSLCDGDVFHSLTRKKLKASVSQGSNKQDDHLHSG